MKTQILVKHYKFRDLTDNCLKSLLLSYLDDTDITVIDSTEDEDYSYANIPVEKISNDIGLIGSFNRFVKDKYDLYVYASNDVIFHPSWLDGIKYALFCDKSIGVLAPMYDQADGGVLEMQVPKDLLPGTNAWVDWISDRLEDNPSFIETKHVDNVVFCFTGKLKEDIGLMDDNFPGAGWGANLDYCYRARKAGYKVVAAGKSFIHHAHRGTYGKIDPDYVRKAEEQRDRYLKEKYGDPSIVW